MESYRRCHPDQPDVTIVVELRLWRADRTDYGTRLIPVAVPALITQEEGKPVLLIKDDDGDAFLYPPEELQEEHGSVFILSWPSFEQAQLLSRAAKAGYAIEPRVVGDTFGALEHL